MVGFSQKISGAFYINWPYLLEIPGGKRPILIALNSNSKRLMSAVELVHHKNKFHDIRPVGNVGNMLFPIAIDFTFVSTAFKNGLIVNSYSFYSIKTLFSSWMRLVENGYLSVLETNRWSFLCDITDIAWFQSLEVNFGKRESLTLVSPDNGRRSKLGCTSPRSQSRTFWKLWKSCWQRRKLSWKSNRREFTAAIWWNFWRRYPKIVGASFLQRKHMARHEKCS